jgi:hypothetical protein
MVYNEEYVIQRAQCPRIEELPNILESKYKNRLLRWNISKATERELFVELTLLKEWPDSISLTPVETIYPDKTVVLSIIPTGIGCEIGGYAADAAPATALLAANSDYLITNPNAVNASNFIFMPDRVLYTEGFIIDLFCRGLINLYIPYANRLGLIINKPQPSELDIVFNIINTVRAVHGVNIEDYVITEESIGGRCEQTKAGAYVGGIKNPHVLFDACDDLIARGVNAIAVTSNIEDLPLDHYAEHFDGSHPNPTGGAEAVISHLICKRYGVPAAHAPLLNVKDLNLKSRMVDARGAGEFASTSGLACVLVGLNRAPQIMAARLGRVRDIVNVHNLLAVIAPASALGGIPLLYARRHGIPIIAVRENKTILDVGREKLNLTGVVEVHNYPEAAGIVQALKQGLNIASLYRPLLTLKP